MQVYRLRLQPGLQLRGIPNRYYADDTAGRYKSEKKAPRLRGYDYLPMQIFRDSL